MQTDKEETLVEEVERPGRRWRVLAVELVVIFIGITASFWVDEWREQRQDTETFHRILGEIYYDAILDESGLAGMAAFNNLALRHASNMAIRETDPPPGDELVTQLDIVFDANRVSPTLGGYNRLTNTPLAIPVNDVQLDLDYRYGLYVSFHEEAAREFSDLRALRAAEWADRGVSQDAGAPDQPDGSVADA
jgi:hypothetical protein